MLLSGHEEKNLFISTWGRNLKIANMVDILNHEGGGRKSQYFTVLYSLEYIQKI